MTLRAQCKALRMFRRRLTPLGRTADGHPLFEVDSLKLALPAGARHFHRVLACSRCGAEILEWDRAVAHPHDLGARRRERLCDACSAVPREGETADPDPATSPALDLPEVDPDAEASVAEAKHADTGPSVAEAEHADGPGVAEAKHADTDASVAEAEHADTDASVAEAEHADGPGVAEAKHGDTGPE